MKKMSMEDRMTGLKNRKAFEKYIKEIQEGKIRLENAMLLFIEITGLKQINDVYGMKTGDESVYRYDQMGTHSYENSSMQTGTNGTSYYFSVASGDITNFFNEVDLNTPWDYHYENLDSRTILDRLAAVKYFVVKAGEEEYLPYGYDTLAAEVEKK